MNDRSIKSPRRRTCSRTFRVWGATAALLALALVVCPGCDKDIRQEFVSAAISNLESGVNAIMDGLLDGLFEVAEPAASSTGGSGGTSS